MALLVASMMPPSRLLRPCRIKGRTCNVWLEHGGENWPTAGWLHTVLAAPTVYDTQAAYLRMDPRRNFAAFCMPPVGRESLHEGGAQAWWPSWCIHKASTAFYAAVRSSECRHGAGEKKGGKVGASSRGEEKRNGKIKGELFWKRGGIAE